MVKRKYSDSRGDFLIYKQNGIIKYYTIRKFLVEGKNDDFYIYYKYIGILFNEIFKGVMFEDELTKETKEREYILFCEILNQKEEIHTEELAALLPLSIHGNYSEPF